MTRLERVSFFALVTFRAFLGILDLLGVLILGAIMATLVSDISQSENRFTRPFSSDLGWSLEAFLLVSVSVVFLAKTGGGLFAVRKTEIFLSKLEVRIGKSVLDFYAKKGLPQISSQTPARLQWEVTAGPSILTSTILGSVVNLISDLTLISFIIVALAFLDLLITLAVVLGTALLVWLLQVFLYPHLEKKAREQRELGIESSNSLINFMTMAREAIASGQARYFVDRTHRLRARAATARASQMFVFSMPRHLLEISLIMIVVAVLSFHISNSAPEETLLTLGVFLVGGLRVAGAIMPIQNSLSTLRVASAEIESVQEVLEKAHSFPQPMSKGRVSQEPQLTGARGSETGSGPLAVDFETVDFFYPDAPTPALRAVDLQIASGSFAAVIGESGAGKSTLADLALGLLQPSEGNIYLDATSAWDFRIKNPGTLSYVTQGARIFAGTLLENVTFGAPIESTDTNRVLEVLDVVGLSPLVSRLSNGLATEIGVFESGLSGGQRQRLCIARALYGRPRFLVFDEATSSLDASSESRIAKALLQLKDQTTLLVIAHRLSTIVKSDVIFVLDNGELATSGTFEEVVRTHDKTRKNAELLGLI